MPLPKNLGGSGSVLSHLALNPISYETGEASVLRRTVVNRKVASATEPTPDSKKPIPSVSRPAGAGKRSF